VPIALPRLPLRICFYLTASLAPRSYVPFEQFPDLMVGATYRPDLLPRRACRDDGRMSEYDGLDGILCATEA
jgi:hypothetical protein